MHKRILLLGCTGTEKSTTAERCRETLIEDHGHAENSIRIIDFEKEYLENLPTCRSLASYLQKPLQEQFALWNHAWRKLASDLTQDKTTILLIHATAVRDYYGVRIGISIERVCDDFQPTLVVTLADDVYAMWDRTQQRAQGNVSIGTPTFEQLLMARRVEIMVGDMVLRQQLEQDKRARHLFLSTNHPISTLTNIILTDAKAIYLSFPISAPRELADGNNDHQAQGREVSNAINHFHQAALDCQRKNPMVAFISPLAIDELPFAFKTRDELQALFAQGAKDKDAADDKHFVFNVKERRWPTADIWGNSMLLSKGQPERVDNIPLTLARNVLGLVESDVGWRDYRLVLQADYLACFSPVVPRPDNTWRISRGVKDELEKAAETFIPSFVYQEPLFDPTKAWNTWLGKHGSMGTGASKNTYIQPANSLQELFDKILAQAKRDPKNKR